DPGRYRVQGDLRDPLGRRGRRSGRACWAWESMRPTWRRALEAGDAIPVVQVTSKPLADLPKVPQAISLAKTDEARRLIQVRVQDGSAYSRLFIGPPGTPKDRVQVLRTAFVAALFALEPA